MQGVERFAFYERAKSAFAIVADRRTALLRLLHLQEGRRPAGVAFPRSRTDSLPEPPLQRDPGEQNEPGVAVGAKEPERRRRVRAFDLRRLPGEMRRIGEPADQRDRAPARGFDRRQRQRRGRGVESADAELDARAEQAGGRADADDGVVARVLQRVDRVVADRPGEGGRVEQDRREREAREGRAPAHQRPPREGEAERGLRPGGHALHQRVDRDDAERGDPEPDRETVEAQEHREADQRLSDEERGRRAES